MNTSALWASLLVMWTDLLYSGEARFEDEVMKPLKETFKFGTEEQHDFRYVGMNVFQHEDEGVIIDFDHYVQTLEIPEMESVDVDKDGIMDQEGQTAFRSVVSKIVTIGYQCRPDIIFDTKILSACYNKATMVDMKHASKLLTKIKSSSSSMKVPRLGNLKNWVIVGHGDAGIKSMPDKHTSVRGQVVMICDRLTNKACTILWRARKIKRKVNSSLAGEALATLDTIGEVVYLKSVLEKIFGTQARKIPVIITTDSQNVHAAVYSTSLVEEAWSITDVAAIKDAMEDKHVDVLLKVDSVDQVANCLTKRGAGAAMFLKVLKEGMYCLPGGWDQVREYTSY